MKPSEIKVGKTYCNRGRGLMVRRVVGIGKEFKPSNFYSHNEPPDEPGVQYMQISIKGNQVTMYSGKLYLSSFASWAGKRCRYEQK